MQSRFKWWQLIAAVTVSACVGSWLFLRFRHDKAGHAHDDIYAGAYQIAEWLASPGDLQAVLDFIVLPPSLQGKSSDEVSRSLVRYLSDELSAQGLDMLRNKGNVRPLVEAFPREGTQWAQNAGVDPFDCIAITHPVNDDLLAVLVACTNVAGNTKIIRIDNVRHLSD
jgi:hypothetical protein